MAEAFSVPHTAVCLSTAAARTASPAVPPVFELEVEKRRRRLVNVDDKEQQQQRPRKRQQRAPDSSHTAGGLSLPGLLERRMALVAERDCDVWRVFGRQEDALQTLNSLTLHSHCTTPSSTLHLFSHELSGSSGAREFIVSSYAAFYRRYMALPARHRHHYELIMYRQRQNATTHRDMQTHTQPPALDHCSADVSARLRSLSLPSLPGCRVSKKAQSAHQLRAARGPGQPSQRHTRGGHIRLWMPNTCVCSPVSVRLCVLCS